RLLMYSPLFQLCGFNRLPTAHLLRNALVLLGVLLVSLALAATAHALNPPPDGGYPNFNTAEGDNALFSLTTGTGNTASGNGALFNNTAGSSNTATGLLALYSNKGGFYNTATGVNALFSNVTGGG